MTRVRTQDLDTGTDGTALSATNTDFVSFFGTSNFSSAFAKNGSLSARFHESAAVAAATWGRFDFLSTTVRYFRRYIYIPTSTAALHTIGRTRAGTTAVGHVRLSSTNKLILADAALTALATTTTSVPIGAWWRYEVGFDGTTATLRLFIGANVDGTIPDEEISSTIPATAFDNYGDGFLTARASYAIHVDAIADDDVAWPGPAASGADATAPSMPANLRATAVGTTTADLAWDVSTDNVGVTGYEVTVTGPI